MNNVKTKLKNLFENIASLAFIATVSIPVLLTIFLYVQIGMSGNLISSIRYVLYG